MMSWEYGYTRYAFELFTDNFSLRDAFQDVRVIETIAGDDSIDLETTGTIASGESYLIIDRKTGAQQQVTIKEILTGRRVLLHEIMQFSTNDTAVLSKSSWEYVGNKAEASAGATYMTVMTKLLDDIESGQEYFDLVEVMTCVGGCVGGAGVVMPAAKGAKAVENFATKGKV